MKRFTLSKPGKLLLFILAVLILSSSVAFLDMIDKISSGGYYDLTPDDYLRTVQKDDAREIALEYLEQYLQGAEREYVIRYDMTIDVAHSRGTPPREDRTNEFAVYVFEAKAVWNDNPKGYEVDIWYPDYHNYIVTVRLNSPMYDLSDSRCNQARIAFRLRYPLIPLAIVCAVLGFGLLAILVMVAGRRYGESQLQPGFAHKLPIEVLLALTGCLVLSVYASNHSYSEEIMRFLLGETAAVAAVIGLAMAIAVRIKAHTLWTGSILRRLTGWVRALLRHLSLFRQTIVVLALVIALELLLLSFSFPATVLWILEKLVLVPLILYVACCMAQLYRAGTILAEGDLSQKIETNGMVWAFRNHAEHLNSLSSAMTVAVEQRIKSERMKTELITNVSHDLKTPLTSLVNYATLISREPCDNEHITEYADVLVRQSDKLKRLIEDLVEASKLATGNLDVALSLCDPAMFIAQTSGEYQQKLADAGLTLIVRTPETPLRIQADGRRMWRVFDNLMGNICKYSLPGTRVYLTLEQSDGQAVLTFRNTAREPLTVSADELTERFVRGDTARNTEGSGLGLSIAVSLTELQGGKFQLETEEDLFRVRLYFPLAN